MKVFFDTNVYVAEALLGEAAERMLEATRRSSWRIFTSSYVLAEIAIYRRMRRGLQKAGQEDRLAPGWAPFCG